MKYRVVNYQRAKNIMKLQIREIKRHFRIDKWSLGYDTYKSQFCTEMLGSIYEDYVSTMLATFKTDFSRGGLTLIGVKNEPKRISKRNTRASKGRRLVRQTKKRSRSVRANT